ncbi:MAG: MATE family efflux transporter, partial [Treponemataceae bacterium]|nr:MATE family efflux transporter [Treponemataceae bacterium]
MAQNIRNYSIARLAWPIFLQMLLSLCLGYADTAMVSRYSDTAVGAIGNASQLLGFLMLAFTIISSATGVVVAQYLGAGQDSQMNRIYTVALSFNLALSVLLCAAVAAFCRPLLALLNVPAVMRDEAAAYMRIVGCFLSANALISVFFQIFNCNGKTYLGTILVFSMNVMNIIGNYVFLYGPLSFLGLGTTGVAISTSASSVIGVVTAYICFRTVIGGRISVRLLAPFPRGILAKLVRLGIPTAGENISYNISQICITTFANLLGPTAITTKIYCAILCGFSMVYSNSVAGATAIITGHSVGGGDDDFAARRVMKSLASAAAVSLCLAALNWRLSRHTLRLFTDNAGILALGSRVMFIAIFLELGRTLNLVVIQSMRAAGDVVFPTALG